MELKNKESLKYLNNVINFRKEVFKKKASNNPNEICFSSSLVRVKKVVIISSAPRSGSSLLFQILRKIPQFYSLSGEGVPFYKLNGISSDDFICDEIPNNFKKTRNIASGISRDFLSDFSQVSSQNDIFTDNQKLDQYIDDLALRFALQWPQVRFNYNFFRNLAIGAFNTYKKTNQRFCKEKFYLELLWFLRQKYKVINPYYYDIPKRMITKKFSRLKVPLSPPNDHLMIEEPPFILLSPDKKVENKDLSDKTLLLKSSTDSYRMDFIRQLMPNANIKFIYLIRNPAASINGLYDGWLHRGFFSHNLKVIFSKNKKSLGTNMLKISGYSDKYPWGKWWWNYDLPCGWQDYAQSRLEEVCGFQWYLANLAIKKYLDWNKKQYCQVRHENIIKSLKSRNREVGRILKFIGIGRYAEKQLRLENLGVVQATEPPRPHRWKKRKDILLPVLNNPKIKEMAIRLGYINMQEWL